MFDGHVGVVTQAGGDVDELAGGVEGVKGLDLAVGDAELQLELEFDGVEGDVVRDVELVLDAVLGDVGVFGEVDDLDRPELVTADEDGLVGHE